MRVLAAHHPDVVIWEVAASPLVPEWVGTRPTFTMTATTHGCRLDFTHHGLVPALLPGAEDEHEGGVVDEDVVG